MQFISTPVGRGLIIILAAILIAISAQTVQAEGQAGYTWQLKFDFSTDLKGILTVKMGLVGLDGLIADPVIERRFSVPCNNVGNVVILAGAAVFDGTNYLACDLDLKTAIEQTQAACPLESGACPARPDDFDLLHSIAGWGEMRLASTDPGAVSPIFYHEDFSFSFTPYGATMNLQKTSGGDAASALFPVPANVWQTFGPI